MQSVTVFGSILVAFMYIMFITSVKNKITCLYKSTVRHFWVWEEWGNNLPDDLAVILLLTLFLQLE